MPFSKTPGRLKAYIRPWTQRGMSRISGLRNDMNKEPFIKNEKSTIDVLISRLNKNIIVPLILDINGYRVCIPFG